MTFVILARHGESTFNREGKIQGQFDCPLTLKGESQARRLGVLLLELNLPIDIVHSSGLMRADQTARLAMQEVTTSLPILIYPALKERNWGLLQGQVGEDIRGERDRCLAWDAIPAEGESFIEVAQRTTDYLANIALPLLQMGRTLICFSHAGPLATLQCQIEGLPWNDPAVGIPNAGARVYELEAGILKLKTIIYPN